VTDLKAAVCYIRYNEGNIAGSMDRIFTFGMSGGGAFGRGNLPDGTDLPTDGNLPDGANLLAEGDLALCLSKYNMCSTLLEGNMKVVVAIDSLKGSLSSVEAGNAAREGILKACDAEVIVKPLADGGEGTTEALVEGLGGSYAETIVTGPMGAQTKAKYGILDEKKAVMEMAEAAGIILVDRNHLNPWKATTTGVGEMILDAIRRGCREFIIGIGGSATTEGGIGMLEALGYEFYDSQGKLLPPVFESLGRVERISAEKVPEELKECHFQIACDVTNPLCGQNGAVAVFGPQKGVKTEEKEEMDTAMQHYAQKTAEFIGKDHSQAQGAGAAGGLGFAFLSYLPNVELKSGIAIVLEAIDLEKELQDTDVVVTGEGLLDAQTAMGKVPVGVAHCAKRYGCKVIAFAGGVTEDAGRCNEEGIDAFFPIVRGVTTLDEAMDKERAKKNMSLSVEQVFRLI
jgi:glycerate kinase